MMATLRTVAVYRLFAAILVILVVFVAISLLIKKIHK